MYLAAVKASRFPTRVYLKFSDGLLLPFFIDDLVIMTLTAGQEIDEEKFKKIINSSLLYLARDYALKQIAISPKSEKTLCQKLKVYLDRSILKYKIPKNGVDLNFIIDACIEKIKSQGLLGNEDYVKFFINKNKRKSKREIVYLLQKEGISIETIPSSYFSEDDLEKIRILLRKKVSDPQNLLDFNFKNKITAFLYRKGFSLSDIKTVIDEYLYSR
jgi:SOS response regulatory protein OraA/RecX